MDSLEKAIELKNEGKNYEKQLRELSEYPETLPDKEINIAQWEKCTPEETAKMREEYNEKKEELIKEWEKKHGMEWPRYTHDVYSANGKLIRKAGDRYDLHHIQPLGMGGKNEVSNITPLHAEVHYDKQGIHSSDSPYNKIDKLLGGSQE